MRALIEQRLACAPKQEDPVARLLGLARGPVSSELQGFLSDTPCSAAVLLALVERSAGLQIVLTKRAGHLSDHPGQISFPGGRIEQSDDGPVSAALREAQEEIGMAPALVTVAGPMQQVLTGTGFLITPVIGFVEADFQAVPDAREVDEVFELPLDFLLTDGNLRTSTRDRFGTTLTMYEFDYAGHYIWGATATMLMNFVKLIS